MSLTPYWQLERLIKLAVIITWVAKKTLVSTEVIDLFKL